MADLYQHEMLTMIHIMATAQIIIMNQHGGMYPVLVGVFGEEVLKHMKMLLTGLDLVQNILIMELSGLDRVLLNYFAGL